MKSLIRFGGIWTFVCKDKYGNEKWRDASHNLVVNEGLNHILDGLFNSADSSGFTVDPFYIGLLGSAPSPAAEDILDSSLEEITAYDEATRQEYVGVRTDQTVSNSTSKATFTVDTNSTTIGGAILAGDNTKGGSTGILLCEVAFSNGDRTLNDNETIEVQYDFSASDDGA